MACRIGRWVLVCAAVCLAAGGAVAADRFPALADVGDVFRFAICADPQVGHADDPGTVAANARRTQMLAVEELNAMEPKPAFVVFLGDLCNKFDAASVANFESCIAGLEAPAVLVHGNHDTQPPYTDFRALMQRVCGFEDVFYSFDAGRWHFVVLPCNLGGASPEQREAETAMLDWLDADLSANRDRPTMVFEHFHAMPQGLTQLEWYNFPLALRLKIMDLLTRHDNVKWYFNGHVHNGIQTSIKTSWRYRGINFVTAPTIVQSRNFGDEYETFRSGLDTGGYYLVVDVEGDLVLLKGRLAGLDEEVEYPGQFQPFKDELEPRWFRRVTEIDSTTRLFNGGFEDGLEGWRPCYRYRSETDPGFVWEAPSRWDRPGERAGYVLTRAKEPVSWANDEMTELYQLVQWSGGGAPVFRASYCVKDVPENGGGYLRLVAANRDEFRFTMMFKWGENERQSHIVPRAFGYAVTGEQQSWLFLQQLGEAGQGMYWDVPAADGQWHALTADIAALYDAAHGVPGAFDKLNVTKFLIGIGTWVNRDAGSESGAYFDDIQFGAEEAVTSGVDGTPLVCDESVFRTQFGQELEDRVSGKAKKAK